MKTTTIFIYILINTLTGNAQWNKVEKITSPLIFSALFTGNNIFIGGDSLFISRDKGLTWSSKALTSPTEYITALFKADSRIFAGTYGEGIFQSTDDGLTWNSFNTGLGAFANYASVFLQSGDTLFYGSDGGGIYFAEPGSTQWQSYNQNLPSNYAWSINDLAATNNNLIASAGASGYYYLRPKGSAEWIERRIQTPDGVYTTPNVFLTCGDTVFAGSRWGIYRSIDDGYSWDSVGISALPLDVVELIKDDSRIYAGFTRSSGNDFFIWYSDDYGNTWNFYDHQFQFLHHLYIYDNKIWAATNDGLWFNELSSNYIDPDKNHVSFSLSQNYPNPFNPSTNIEFWLDKVEFVSLKVFDATGNEIAVLINEEKPAGAHNIKFDASHLSSGIYFYNLQAGNFFTVKKMALIK